LRRADFVVLWTTKTYARPPPFSGDLLRRLGRREEAAAAYRQALQGADLEPERRFLIARLEELS